MVSDSTDVTRGPRRTWPPLTRTAAAIIAAAAVALPAAVAFGSSQPTNVQKARAYSRCMRAHGVPNFPDPNSSGAIPKLTLQQLGVSLSVWQAAQTGCERLLPNGGGPSPAQVREWMNGMRTFAQCMRSRGVANWPDPVIDAGGNPEFYLDWKVNQNAPQTKAKIQACLHFLPSFAISPGNPVACPGASPGPNPGPGCGSCGCRRRR
jgi:hypothetical protein